MLAQQIILNWETTAKGYATKIMPLFEAGFPAWTVKTTDFYGVAIPIPEWTEVSERFSGAKLYNDTAVFNGEEQKNVLLLTTELQEIEYPFATLCAELIVPGENGELRKEVEIDPVAWWAQWKELLGNKNVDDRIYDILGELCALRYLSKIGKQAIWNGPSAATYDIDGEDTYYEVKSTTARNKRQVTLSNHFQLDPPNGKNLKLIFCQFEPSHTGENIDKLVDELSNLGYNKQELNQKLELLGLENRKSARRRCYDLHAMIAYEINSEFPAIRESSFIGGTLPVGIQSLTYTVSLDGIKGENITDKQGV